MLPLPAGGVTGIGSLPHTDPAEAVRFVAEVCPEIPFWPQLPRRDPREGLVAQALAGLESLLEPRGDGIGFRVPRAKVRALSRVMEQAPGDLTRDCAAGFFAFKNALASGSFPHAGVIKAQVTGPVTLASNLWVEGKSFAGDPDLLRPVAARVISVARWQLDSLNRQGRPVLMFVDEPSIATHAGSIMNAEMAHLRTATGAVLRAIEESGGLSGLHCCGRFPFALLQQLRPNIVSFDAFHGMEAFGGDADARAFIMEGGVVAYGLAPAVPEKSDPEPRDLRSRWKRTFTPEMLGRAARQSLVTPTCGISSATEDYAKACFRTAIEVAASLRATSAVRG